MQNTLERVLNEGDLFIKSGHKYCFVYLDEGHVTINQHQRTYDCVVKLIK